MNIHKSHKSHKSQPKLCLHSVGLLNRWLFLGTKLSWPMASEGSMFPVAAMAATIGHHHLHLAGEVYFSWDPPGTSCENGHQKSPLFMVNSTISMAMFNSYVSLPEAIFCYLRGFTRGSFRKSVHYYSKKLVKKYLPHTMKSYRFSGFLG